MTDPMPTSSQVWLYGEKAGKRFRLGLSGQAYRHGMQTFKGDLSYLYSPEAGHDFSSTFSAQYRRLEAGGSLFYTQKPNQDGYLGVKGFLKGHPDPNGGISGNLDYTYTPEDGHWLQGSLLSKSPRLEYGGSLLYTQKPQQEGYLGVDGFLKGLQAPGGSSVDARFSYVHQGDNLDRFKGDMLFRDHGENGRMLGVRWDLDFADKRYWGNAQYKDPISLPGWHLDITSQLTRESGNPAFELNGAMQDLRRPGDRHIHWDFLRNPDVTQGSILGHDDKSLKGFPIDAQAEFYKPKGEPTQWRGSFESYNNQYFNRWYHEALGIRRLPFGLGVKVESDGVGSPKVDVNVVRPEEKPTPLIPEKKPEPPATVPEKPKGNTERKALYPPIVDTKRDLAEPAAETPPAETQQDQPEAA